MVIDIAIKVHVAFGKGFHVAMGIEFRAEVLSDNGKIYFVHSAIQVEVPKHLTCCSRDVVENLNIIDAAGPFGDPRVCSSKASV